MERPLKIIYPDCKHVLLGFVIFYSKHLLSLNTEALGD